MRLTLLPTVGALVLALATDGARARASEDDGGAAVGASVDPLFDLVADPHGPAVIDVPAGVHRGDLVVKRAVTLRGQPGAVLEGSGGGTVITIEASDVVIEGLAIRRSGRRHTSEDAGVKAKGERVRLSRVSVEDSLFGIMLHECKACVIEHARVTGYADDAELRGDGIKLWESHDSVVRDSTLERSRDLVVWYTRRATLERNTVRSSRYGSHFMYAHDAVVRDSHFENNVVGVFVMYSRHLTLERNVVAGSRGAAGVALGFKDSDAIEVRGNWLVANTAGTYFDNTPRTPEEPVHFAGNVVALNNTALRLHSSEKGLHLTGNDFRDNALLVDVEGGGNALGLEVRGNHFSDYAGYDLNHDGVGDVAYEVKALSSELTDSHPALRFFEGTAAMGVIDAVAHAVPVLAAKQLLVDPAPLVGSPEVPLP
jgi:nitrous oxidase accessory protein